MNAFNHFFAFGRARVPAEHRTAIRRRIANGVRSTLALAYAAALGWTVTLPSPASASFVTQWGYQIDSGFTAFAPDDVTGSFPNMAIGAPSLLSWGDATFGGPVNGPQSSLSVNHLSFGRVTGNLTTNGGPDITGNVTHTNNPVFAPFLTSATLANVLTLTPLVPPGAPVQLMPPLQVLINFFESPNAEPCDSVSGTPCNDIFVVSAPGLNPADNSFSQQFEFMDQLYQLRLVVLGLSQLTEQECIAAGALAGCRGFVTEENSTNQFDTLLEITAVPIPPAGILFLTALAGLGAVARRGKAKAV